MNEPLNISILNKFPATTGFIERAALALAVLVLAKLHIDPALIPIPIVADFINEILVAAVGALIFSVAKWQNRPVNLAEAVRAVSPSTQIVTTPEVAGASKDAGIVSTASNKVVAKALLVLFMVSTLSLGGCTKQFEVLQIAVQEALTPRTNPITQADLHEVEKGLVVAATGLNLYKQLCIRKAIDISCRETIAYLQKTYTRPAKIVLANLRKFVKENNQVSALSAYNTLKQIMDDLKRETPAIGAQ